MNPTLRPELEELPERMRGLHIDKRGYPVPWFVAWVNGEPEFRAMDGRKFSKAVKYKRCWVCGEQLGKYMTFVIGPMCGINRISSEPPSHLECAQWSARNCPFLTQREMKRREDDFTRSCPVAGISAPRNPGVALLWTTRSYTVFRDHQGKPLIKLGDPESTEFWSHGRMATRREVEESVETGLPFLFELAARDHDPAASKAAILQAKQWLTKLYPTVA